MASLLSGSWMDLPLERPGRGLQGVGRRVRSMFFSHTLSQLLSTCLLTEHSASGARKLLSLIPSKPRDVAISWATLTNVISILPFLIQLPPTPMHISFYLGRGTVLKKIPHISFTPNYLRDTSNLKKKMGAEFFLYNHHTIWSLI